MRFCVGDWRSCAVQLLEGSAGPHGSLSMSLAASRRHGVPTTLSSGLHHCVFDGRSVAHLQNQSTRRGQRLAIRILRSPRQLRPDILPFVLEGAAKGGQDHCRTRKSHPATQHPLVRDGLCNPYPVLPCLYRKRRLSLVLMDEDTQPVILVL